MQPGPTSPPHESPSPPHELTPQEEPATLPLPGAEAQPQGQADDGDAVKAAAGAREDRNDRSGATASARGRKRRRRGGTSSTSPSPFPSPAAAAGTTRGVVMVKRDLLARCMTCPLCRRLLRDATTISECLHTCESPVSPPPSRRAPASYYSVIRNQPSRACPSPGGLGSRSPPPAHVAPAV